MDEEYQQYQQRLREDAEQGRKAKIALEFMRDFILRERASVIYQLEINTEMTADEALSNKRWLELLRKFENAAQAFIQLGEMAEKELEDA